MMLLTIALTLTAVGILVGFLVTVLATAAQSHIFAADCLTNQGGV